jgi:hypothetical protein
MPPNSEDPHRPYKVRTVVFATITCALGLSFLSELAAFVVEAFAAITFAAKTLTKGVEREATLAGRKAVLSFTFAGRGIAF